MPERLQTRTEHSRSLAEAKKYRAIHTLVGLGMLIPVSELETYHGRVEEVAKKGQWRVDPSFANGSSDNNNFNLNERPTLYTGNQAVAMQFAAARFEREATKDGKIPAIYSISSPDTDATILNSSFDKTKLSPEEYVEYNEALKELLLPLAEGSPVRFEMRNTVEPFIAELRSQKPYLVTQDDIPAYVAASGADPATATQLAGSYNAYQVAVSDPAYLIDQLISSKDGIILRNQEGTNKKVPLNLEYIARYLHNAHIVGINQTVISATLRGRRVKIVSFFDLEKAQASRALDHDSHKNQQRLGGIAMLIDGEDNNTVPPKRSLKHALQDAHIKPRALVKAAMEVEGYKNVFKGDAGNWEGYALAEHTEAVLNNFDENYADTVPVELLQPMRLAIIAHDVGKPIAVKKGDKQRQKDYNKVYAEHYLTKAGIAEQEKALILAIICNGAELAYQLDVKQAGRPALEELATYARTSLQTIYGNVITQGQVIGFIEMCRMLQACDGGAYTSMAVTGNYRNAPSFNSSFAKPADAGNRKIKPLQKNASIAPNDLTPKLK